MAGPQKKIKSPASNSFSLKELEKMHPYKMLLLMGMAGSALIVFFLLTAYSVSGVFQEKTQSMGVPKAFIVSTFLLFASSFTIARVQEYFKEEKAKELKRALFYTLLLGFGFTGLQFLGWNELTHHQNAYEAAREAAMYLYVLSGIHILHLSAGIIYLAYCYLLLLRLSGDPVMHLVYFTNPFRKLQLNLLVTCWHFLDCLWMILFFYFLFFI